VRIAAKAGGHMVADEFKPYRIKPVQGRKLALGIPPFCGNAGETLNLLGVNAPASGLIGWVILHGLHRLGLPCGRVAARKRPFLLEMAG
jgi:hypothetical protein